MSLMQQAYDTYTYAEKDFCGVYIAGAKEPLAPIGHTITKAAIEITINKSGKFIQANTVLKDNDETIIPVTEESASRTSTAAATRPHPLCDRLKFLYPESEESYQFFIKQLAEWESSEFTHPVLTSVLKYIKSGTIITDLSAAGLIKKNINGDIKNDACLIRWIVLGIGEESGPCWKNRNLQIAFIKWRQSLQIQNKENCMITGKMLVPAKLHARGVVPRNEKAKLISANDKSGFTYRGRFLNDTEALCIGYETSQKSHNALRWVVANQGTYYGGRCFVCWNPQGKQLPRPTGIMARRGLQAENSYTPTAYKEQLHNTLASWKNDFQADARAVTAVFDAATSGRLSLTYYSELQADDFIERLAYWEESCCWPNGEFGIQSPPLYKISEYAFGTLRANGFEADDNVTKQIMLQLLSCRVEKSAFPASIERALVQKSGNLQIVPDDEDHKYLRRDLLYTTCAVIRKYYYDKFKEEWSMALEPEKKDRSYQFGRLMAILEKIEKDTYDSKDKREPNIIRRQQAFSTKPYSVAVSVLSHLKTAYYPQLSVAGRNYYEKQIEEIMEILSGDETNLNKPLSDVYLLGYYLQKKNLYTSKKENVEE